MRAAENLGRFRSSGRQTTSAAAKVMAGSAKSRRRVLTGPSKSGDEFFCERHVAVLVMTIASIASIASLAGGYGGAHVDRQLPKVVTRTVVILFGLLVTVKLLISG